MKVDLPVRVLALALAALVAGCGDNSKECGPGTANVAGVCTSVSSCGTGTKDDGTGTCVPDGTVVCTGGTKFDAATGQCQIDPSACQDGTVLIGTACVDPASGPMVDVEEGAEPNGLGVLGETSTAPAGLVTLKASGTTVIHGKIIPVDRDGDGRRDADVDAYVFSTPGPAYLHVTADGVHGLVGGFLAFANGVSTADPLASWQRLGITLTSDTAKRDLFVPSAGTYVLAIADSRSLVLGASPAGADANAPAFEYYVSITAQPIPQPTALTLTGGKAVVTGTLDPGSVKFYTMAMGHGLNDVTMEAPPAGPDPSDSVNASVVVLADSTFRNVGREHQVIFFGQAFTLPAELVEGGFTGSETALVVADTEYDWNIDPTPFRLSITTSDAMPLPTGGTATETLITNSPPSPFTTLNWFYVDVATAGQTDAFELAFNVPVDAVLLDQHARIVAPFTWLQGQPTGNTMTAYQGLIRFPQPGRYYFGVYDPAGTPGTSQIIATSSFAPLATPVVAVGTPLASVPVAAGVGATAVRFDGSTSPWDVFRISGTSTGAIDATYYALGDAFGRLDPVDIVGLGSHAPDPAPLFAHTYPEAGDAVDRILLDDPSPQYYVHVRPATAGSVTFDFAAQSFTDIGTLAPPAIAMRTGSATATPQRYLLRTTRGDRVTLTVHPTSAAATLAVDLLANDESVLRTFSAPAAGSDASLAYIQAGKGWTALQVTSSGAAQPYTLGVAIDAPRIYGHAASTTAFSDACATGTIVALANDDDAVSAPLAAPAGFTLFGIPEPSLVISTNGWLSFDTTVTDPAFANTPIPTADDPNALVAPYWDDLNHVVVCTQVTGTKLIVQWTGQVFGVGSQVQVQAILDGAMNTIEFVYGPQQVATGANANGDPGATIGLEDPAGVTGTQLGFNQSVVMMSTATKFTPN